MRGEISYVTLMVLNPVIILFYQNCSVFSAERAMAHKADPPAISSRAPASVQSQGNLPGNLSLKLCPTDLTNCPQQLE